MLGEEPKDIDLFAVREDVLLHAIDEFEWSPRFNKTTRPNSVEFAAYGVACKVQFVKRCFYPQHEQLIQSFDFTICQAYLFYTSREGWVGYCTEEFLRDFAERKLVYTAPTRDEDPAGSLLRVVRFLKRGFHISEADLAKVLARLFAAITPEPEPILQEKIQTQFRRVGYGGKTRSV